MKKQFTNPTPIKPEKKKKRSKVDRRYSYVTLEPIENSVFTNNFGEKFVVLPIPEDCVWPRSATLFYKKYDK